MCKKLWLDPIVRLAGSSTKPKATCRSGKACLSSPHREGRVGPRHRLAVGIHKALSKAHALANLGKRRPDLDPLVPLRARQKIDPQGSKSPNPGSPIASRNSIPWHCPPVPSAVPHAQSRANWCAVRQPKSPGSPLPLLVGIERFPRIGQRTLAKVRLKPFGNGRHSYCHCAT